MVYLVCDVCSLGELYHLSYIPILIYYCFLNIITNSNIMFIILNKVLVNQPLCLQDYISVRDNWPGEYLSIVLNAERIDEEFFAK